MKHEALIFDFDGVLIESEYIGNLHLAECLTALGHPTSVDDALANFVGLGGEDFIRAVADWIGGHVPEAFHTARRAEDERVLREGLAEVAGAAAFVRALPDALPRAIASSSTTHWIRTHLGHLGLLDRFEGRIFSGREALQHKLVDAIGGEAEAVKFIEGRAKAKDLKVVDWRPRRATLTG